MTDRPICCHEKPAYSYPWERIPQFCPACFKEIESREKVSLIKCYPKKCGVCRVNDADYVAKEEYLRGRNSRHPKLCLSCCQGKDPINLRELMTSEYNKTHGLSLAVEPQVVVRKRKRADSIGQSLSDCLRVIKYIFPDDPILEEIYKSCLGDFWENQLSKKVRLNDKALELVKKYSQ